MQFLEICMISLIFHRLSVNSLHLSYFWIEISQILQNSHENAKNSMNLYKIHLKSMGNGVTPLPFTNVDKNKSFFENHRRNWNLQSRDLEVIGIIWSPLLHHTASSSDHDWAFARGTKGAQKEGASCPGLWAMMQLSIFAFIFKSNTNHTKTMEIVKFGSVLQVYHTQHGSANASAHKEFCSKNNKYTTPSAWAPSDAPRQNGPLLT